MATSLCELPAEELTSRAETLEDSYRQPVTELVRLLREQRFHQETLDDPGVMREQRRIHAARLREVQQEIKPRQRVIRALEAGWMPFQPSAEWYAGFVRDPRFLRGRAGTISVASASLVGIGLALALGTSLPAGGAVLAAGLVAFVLYVIVSQATGRYGAAYDRMRTADAPLNSEQRRITSELLVFNAPMPLAAIRGYRLAVESGLFDCVLVYSPRRQDFRTVTSTAAPSLEWLDPILVGVIGRQCFQIAQWDLGKDLSLQP